MKIINRYIIFVYVILIAAVVVMFVDFLIHLGNTIKNINALNDGLNTMNNDLNSANEKIAHIKDTGKSWSFFGALFAVYMIIKETLKYRKSEKSISKSLAKACLRHSTQLRSFHL
ncbi:MAG: hypothetical protein IK151_07095 [Erysipelotrichaceae bacterium]|nr:hypothetical protein [Erysipelotrichaceae bacterium]